MTLLFDRLAYMDSLKRAGLSEEHARAYARAFEQATADKTDRERLQRGIKMENRKLILWAVAVVAAAALLGIAIFLSRPYAARLQEGLAGIEQKKINGMVKEGGEVTTVDRHLSSASTSKT